MSLDVAILGEDGTPSLSAALDVEAHAEVVALAERLGVVQILRMRDYYEDVDFERDDARILLFEFERLRESLSEKSGLAVDDVMRVLREAENREIGVSVIAD